MQRWQNAGYDAGTGNGMGAALVVMTLGLIIGAVFVVLWLGPDLPFGGTKASGSRAETAQPAAAEAPAPAAMAVPKPVALTVADWDMPGGHFFTQTNGRPSMTSNLGYAVTNDGSIPFWDEFRRLGDVGRVGYPLSRRFEWQGRVTQVFQRAILQWAPVAQQTLAVNVMDLLSSHGADEWLIERHDVPKPLPADFDAGLSAAEAFGRRLVLLEADQAMGAYFNAAPDAVMLYGLPASRVVDMGDHYALRTQRSALERWKVDKPWARAGEVTAALGGQMAVEAGLVPADALEPFALEPVAATRRP